MPVRLASHPLRSWTPLVLLLAALVGSACSKQDAPAEAQQGPPPKVPTVTLQPKEVEISSEYLGAIESRRSITVYPQVAAHVSAIVVRPGARVERGALLLRLDAREETAALSQAEAMRSQVHAERELARANRERASRLAREGAMSKQDFDRADADASAAEARANAAEAEVRTRSVQRRFRDIVAPFSGVVGDIPVKVGDYVTPQTRLTVIDQGDSRLEVAVDVPIFRARQVEQGRAMIEVLDEAGEPIAEAPVTFVAPRPEQGTQLVRLKSELGEAPFLADGQFVRARVIFGAERALTVPPVAVTRQSGQTFVYVVGTNGGKSVIHQRPVELGRLQGDEWVVNDGLKPGDQVAVGQVQLLAEGMPITPVPAKASGAGEGTDVGGSGEEAQDGRSGAAPGEGASGPKPDGGG